MVGRHWPGDTAEGDKEEEIEDQEDNKVIDTDREEMSSLCTQLTLTLRLLITLSPLIFLHLETVRE